MHIIYSFHSVSLLLHKLLKVDYLFPLFYFPSRCLPTYLHIYLCTYFLLCVFFSPPIYDSVAQGHTPKSLTLSCWERGTQSPLKVPQARGLKVTLVTLPRLLPEMRCTRGRGKACAICPARCHSETLTSKGHFISPRLSPKALIKDMLQQQQKKGRKEE